MSNSDKVFPKETFNNLSLDFDKKYEEGVKAVMSLGKNELQRVIIKAMGYPLRDERFLRGENEMKAYAVINETQQIKLSMALENMGINTTAASATLEKEDEIVNDLIELKKSNEKGEIRDGKR